MPPCVLPSQFSAAAVDTPARALMRAVLAQAWEDLRDARLLSYQGPRGAAKLQRDTAAWFASEDAIWPYSFVNICQTLGLDAAALRRALVQPPHHAARLQGGTQVLPELDF